ncbi:MAG: lipocalin family protein [Flavobacteriales bacterium]
MKKSFLLILSILFFSGSILQSCKYQDGPSLSLRTKKARLTGSWDVEKITENDGDVFTPDANNSIKYTFNKSGTGDYTVKVLGISVNNTLTWEFVDSKEKVKIVYQNGDIIRPKILRLTNKEFWVLTADGDKWELRKI